MILPDVALPSSKAHATRFQLQLRCAGFSGGIISGNSEFPQFLILGLDKSGKTTLLYRPEGPRARWQ